MKNLFTKLLPALFIIAVWFIFSSPYFLQNKVPYSSTYQVNHFFPWSAYEKFHGPVKNGAMPDITDQIYPWRHFTVEIWKNGQIPLWNPNSFSGNPHLANYQSVVLSPFNLLFFLPFVDVWSVLILLQPLLAAFFTYLLMREFKISKIGSLISSIAFMFSGFMVVWMAYGTLSFAILFLPLSLFSIERWFNKGGTFPLLLLALSIPLSFFSGHFQTSLYFSIFVIAFLIFKILTTKKINATPIIFSLVLGLLISLLQIIPSIELYLNSVRSGIFLKSGGIPFFYLVNIFAPDFFGNPVTRNDWFGYYAEWASFIGIIPFILAILSFSKKNKVSLFFLAIGLLMLFLSMDSPLQKLISSLKIPVISTSNPTRIIVLFSFAFAVLSGFGFDRVKKELDKKSIKRLIPVLFAVGLLFLSIWFMLFVSNASIDKLLIAKRNFILPTGIFLGFVLVTFISSFLEKRKRYMLFLSFLLLVSFDSLRFAQKWMPFDSKELVFPPTSVIEGIRKNIGLGRIFGNFGANIDTYYNFPGIEGYDPLYIERYGEFIRGANTGDFLNAERSVVRVARRGKGTDRGLDLLGTSLIFHPIADTNQNWAYPVWEDKKRFSVVFQDEKFQLFKNRTAMNRVQLFYDYEVIKNKEKIIKRFYSDDFDFRKTLIFEENPNIKLTKEVYTDGVSVGSAEIVSYSPNKIVIKVKTETPAILFLSDNFYPGWKAFVDGKEAKIYRADYTFRTVVVPNGESLVEFNYGF